MAWRVAEGIAEAAEQVPAAYEGWFLQQPERVPATKGGVFFSQCRAYGDEFRLGIGNEDHDSQSWLALAQIVGSFPDVVIRAGNCRLTGEQWLQYLKDQSLPYTGAPTRCYPFDESGGFLLNY